MYFTELDRRDCDGVPQKPQIIFYLMFSLIETRFLTTLKYTKSEENVVKVKTGGARPGPCSAN